MSEEYEKAQRTFDMGRHFAKISNKTLKRQNSSDAWNERSNALFAARIAAELLLRGTMEKNIAKQKEAHNGSRPSQ